MKKNIFIALLIFLSSCSSQLKERGEIPLPNGEGKPVKVEYQIYDFPKLSKKLTMEDFESIAKKAADVSKSLCKNELTFEPIEFSLYSAGSKDTITVSFNMTAKNGFGVPQKQNVYVDFIGTRYIGYFAGYFAN
jgi:hypothetical protein